MIRWSVQIAENWTLIEFFTEGLLDRRKLNEIRLPDELSQRTDMGLIISGPGPIWLYAYLAHLAHHFAWVATYEPRLRGAVIVQSHITGGPVPGDIIPMADKSVPHDSPVSAGKASKRRGCDATYIISSVQDSRSWSDRLGMALFVVFALIALTAGSLLTGAGWSILHDIQWPKVEQVTVPLPANPVTIDSPAPPAVAQDHDHAMTNSLSAVGWAVRLVAIFLFFRLAFWLYRRRFYTHRHLSAYSMILVGI
ncbi:MAG: CRISPR-associated protein Csx3, partial [bacterium]|nr:CRISPR-associated protein Csx3 [bacterium]